MHRYNPIKAALLVAAMMLLLPGCSGAESDAAATFSPLDTAGAETLLAENKGKPVLICFWATWCPACREEIPELQALAEEYGDRIEIAAVSLRDKESDLRQFFGGKAPGIGVYMGSDQLAGRYKVSSIPQMNIHDKKGDLVFSQAGLFPKDMLKVVINKILEQ